MNGMILIGEKNDKEDYVSELIKTKKIPRYNVYSYDTSLKISDVRAIKNLIALAPHGGFSRIFIFREDPTLEAQNAMLKLLEELNDDTYIMFLNYSELIPTIRSRCKEIRIKSSADTMPANDEIKKLLLSFIDKEDEIGAKLLFTDGYFTLTDDLDEFIKCLRDIMIEEHLNGENDKAKYALNILKSISSCSSLVYSNNLNKRLVLERVLLENSNTL